MTINDIKAQFGVKTFSLNYSVDIQTGEKSPWLRHWDNDNRVSISVHEELAKQIKEDSSMATLSLQGPEVREGKQGVYNSYRIVAYKADMHL